MTATIRQFLRPLQLQIVVPLTRHLADFWNWWCAELREMLPSRFREMLAQREKKIFIEPEYGDLHIRYGRSPDERSLLRVPATPDSEHLELPRTVRETMLLLSPDQLLTRTVDLPVAAEENLREVLTFEMNKHTPFPASKVYFDFIVRRRDAETAKLSVELVFAPRDVVDELIARIERHGIRIDVVTSRSRDGNNLFDVNLLPDAARPERKAMVSRLDLGLAALCTALLIVAVVLPIQQKNQLIERLRPAVDGAAMVAHEGSELRQELERMAQTSHFLAAKKQSTVLAVEIVEEISRILPDHTSLSRLSIADAEIQLQGQSSSSASLIAIVESSPLFDNAKFRSPVAQIANTDLDRFHLSADIAGGHAR